MLAQRRIRWANNSPTLGQRLVFDGLHDRRRECTDTKLIGRVDRLHDRQRERTNTKLIGRTNER